MKLTIYRTTRAEFLRPGNVVVGHPDTRAEMKPQAITSVLFAEDNIVVTTGYNPGVDRAAQNKFEMRWRASEQVRLIPTPEQVRGVWGGLCDAIKVAAAEHAEAQEADGVGVDREAPPAEVFDSAGTLQIRLKGMGYFVEPDLPTEPQPPAGG